MTRTLLGRTVTGLTLAGALAALTAGLLAGCGGGSNGVGSVSAAPQTASLSGTVQDGSGAPLAGYKVVYDSGSSALSATTDSTGHYALTVPARDITGADTLSFFDALGSLASTQPVAPVAGGPVAPLTTTIALVPPPPAPIAVKK